MRKTILSTTAHLDTWSRVWGSGGEEEAKSVIRHFWMTSPKLKREGVSEITSLRGWASRPPLSYVLVISIERNAARQYQMHQVQKFRDKGVERCHLESSSVSTSSVGLSGTWPERESRYSSRYCRHASQSRLTRRPILRPAPCRVSRWCQRLLV